MMQAFLGVFFLTILGAATEPVSTSASCVESKWVDARTALLIGVNAADIPGSWNGIEARVRVYEGTYVVTVLPFPSIPDAVASVGLTMCGELIEAFR